MIPTRSIREPWSAKRKYARALIASIGASALVALCSADAPDNRGANGPLPATLPAVADDNQLANVDLVEVKGFHFRGNTAISSHELAKVAEGILHEYPSSLLSLEQIEHIRQVLTATYVERGYINSGAILPDQTIADGIVTFELVEGRLAEIVVQPVEVDGKTKPLRLRKKYVTDRIRRGLSMPLNVNELKQSLELLRQDPNIRRVNAELKSGAAGASELDVKIEESPPFTLGLSFNNHHTVSTGAERFELLGQARDLTGFGDAFSFRYALTEGGFGDMTWAGLDAFSIDYSIPISASGTSLIFSMERSNEPLTERQFEQLDITSDSFSYSLTLRQPLLRAPNRELAVFVTGTYRTNETTLLGERFPLSQESQQGKTRITAIRIGAEFNQARADDALALRSTLSIGTDWFNATKNPDGVPDSQFIAWLGQAQYVRRLGKTDNRLSLRATAQLASDALPALEQFSLGGFDTVRGYRENRLVRDNGVFLSAELFFPVPGTQRGGRTMLELVPFLDAGYAEDRAGVPAGERKFISSAGIGLIATPFEHLRAEVYYGYPFQKFDNRDDLQDLGVHFDVTVSFDF